MNVIRICECCRQRRAGPLYENYCDWCAVYCGDNCTDDTEENHDPQDL